MQFLIDKHSAADISILYRSCEENVTIRRRLGSTFIKYTHGMSHLIAKTEFKES
jgi:hypothetical protein